MTRRDIALAVMIIAVGVLQFREPPFPDPRGFDVGGFWAHAFLVAIVAPVALRERWPWLAFAISTIAALGGAAAGVRDNSMEALAYGIVVYTVVEQRLRYGAPAGALGALAIMLTHVPPWVEGFFPAFVANGVFYGVVWVAGRAQRDRAELAGNLERRGAELTRERELLAAQALAAERRRIAVELERVVAYAMRTARAAVARGRAALSGPTEERDAALAAVERIGREALADMQRLVALLREPAGAAAAPPVGETSERRLVRLPGTLALRSVALAAVAALAFWLEVDDLAGAFPPGARTPLDDTAYLAVSGIAIAAVLLRGIAPGAAVLIVAVMILVGRHQQPMVITTSLFVVQIVVTYTLALRGNRALAIAAVLAGSAAWLIEMDSTTGVVAEALFRLLSLVFAATLGFAVRERQRLVDSLAERTQLLRRTRDERARLAVEQERARVAREMHDSVGHALTLMVLQAEVARRHADRDGPVTAEALADVERLVQQVGDELGALQAGTPPDAEGLFTLVEQAAGAGMDVALEVHGEDRPLGRGLESTLYRITQEALTNARKHADGAPAKVDLRYGKNSVELGVVNGEGVKRGDDALPSGGNGLLAIQERVAVFGGEVRAGPCPEGGFEVRVRIPVDR